jgi:hypothetical protein
MSKIATMKKTPAQKRAETKRANIGKRLAALSPHIRAMMMQSPDEFAAENRAKAKRKKTLEKIAALAADPRGDANVRAVAAAMLGREKS